MAIERETTTHVTVNGTGTLEIERRTFLKENDLVIAGPLYERATIPAGFDVSGESELVQALAAVAWQPETRKLALERLGKDAQSAEVAVAVERRTKG